MPQVSRRTLSVNVRNKIFSIFFKSFARLSNPLDIQKFLLDLLGPVEQTMLAKRLAIAILLSKGYQYDTIKEILKVSQETIARVNMTLNYRGEGYMMIIKKVLRDEKLEKIFQDLEIKAIDILPDSSIRRVLIQDSRSNRKPKRPLG